MSALFLLNHQKTMTWLILLLICMKIQGTSSYNYCFYECRTVTQVRFGTKSTESGSVCVSYFIFRERPDCYLTSQLVYQLPNDGYFIKPEQGKFNLDWYYYEKGNSIIYRQSFQKDKGRSLVIKQGTFKAYYFVMHGDLIYDNVDIDERFGFLEAGGQISNCKRKMIDLEHTSHLNPEGHWTQTACTIIFQCHDSF